MTRLVFMGTPDFAVPTLRGLIDHPDFRVVGVVTQPDRPAGRGRKLQPSPVKVIAQQAGIPIFQPKTLRTPEAVAHLRDWQPEIIVVAAFGQILRPEVLDLPPHGCVNVHASLLPRWRGAAPIQAAIRAGDTESGVTIMVMDAGLDTGPILSQRAIPLDRRETGQSLHDKLTVLGGHLLLETLPGYLTGAITPQPQPDDPSLVTYAPLIKKEEGHINWSMSATAIDRLVRAFTPWPGTYTFWENRLIKIIAGEAREGTATPGQVTALGSDRIAIGTGDGLFAPFELQLAGKKALPVTAFLRGNASIIGSRLR